jgi:hypothetical protein
MNAAIDMRRGLLIVSWLVAALLILPHVARSQDSDRKAASLVLLDGTTVPVQSLSIADGKLSGEGVPSGFVLDDLRRIDLAPVSVEVSDKPAVQIELRGGGRILGKSVTIGDDKCRVEWTVGPPLVLPIDVVRGVRFDPSTPDPEFDKALLAPAADTDRIFLRVDGKTDSITGLIAGLSADQLTVQIDGQERALPRASVLGIVVAQPPAAGDLAHCLVELQGGSRLPGDLTQLSGDRAQLVMPGGGQVEFPWSATARVSVRSRRVAFLSDLKPTAVEESALLTLPRPWQRDKSAMGKPLVLGDRTFEKGIGVHARSSLTFENEGQFNELAATIGLDEQSGGKGDCVFAVLGDGQQLFTKRMAGNDSPHELSLDISRVKKITLLVEPGAVLDLGDLADWADARLIKGKR